MILLLTIFKPVLLNDSLKPVITIGTTIGLLSLIICAVPFLTGESFLVVPCGNEISHPYLRAFLIFLISFGFTLLVISSPFSLP